MTLRYYYAVPTCTVAGMIALEATGAPYEPVLIDLAGDRTAYRAISPMGKVPALQADDLLITETAAIIYWLAATYSQAGLLPKTTEGMANAISVMGWLSSVLHIVRRQYTRPMMFCEGSEAQAAVREAAAPRYWSELQRLDGWIGEGRLGDPSNSLGVESYALAFYHWGLMDRLPMDELEHYTALAKRLAGRDDVRRALVRHDSPLLEQA